MKVRAADKLDLKIRALHPASPVYKAWTNRDHWQLSTMFASVIPTEQYNLKNEDLSSAASTSLGLGITNPVCVPHIGTRLVRNAPEEDEDDADTAQRGDEVDPFGLKVSAIVQQGNPWKTRHDKFEDLIVMLMQHSGMSAKGEPRNVVNGLIPRPLLREYTQEDRVHRVLQGAVPDVAYSDPDTARR